MLRRPIGDLRVETFSSLDDGREQQQIAAPPPFGLKTAAHFITSLRFNRELAVRAMLRPEFREQQAKEVKELRDGGDGALAAAATGALLDAHRRRDAGDQIHVGPRQLLDELARIEIHRIEKTALAFGEQKIKRQRAFTRTAHARNDDQFVAWNFQRKILEVVFARAADGDGVCGGAGVFGIKQHAPVLTPAQSFATLRLEAHPLTPQ